MKLFNILFTLFGVVTVIFFLFQILPGDPARMMMDQNEDVEQLEIIKKKYGFDEPILKQYLYYLNDLSIILSANNFFVHCNLKNRGSFIFLSKSIVILVVIQILQLVLQLFWDFIFLLTLTNHILQHPL